MAAVAILNFIKMSITPDWIKISAPNFMGRCNTAMRDDHVTKSRNRRYVNSEPNLVQSSNTTLSTHRNNQINII